MDEHNSDQDQLSHQDQKSSSSSKNFHLLNQQILDQYKHCSQLTKSTPTFGLSSFKSSSSQSSHDLIEKHLFMLRKMGIQMIHYLSSDATDPEKFKPLHLQQ